MGSNHHKRNTHVSFQVSVGGSQLSQHQKIRDHLCKAAKLGGEKGLVSKVQGLFPDYDESKIEDPADTFNLEEASSLLLKFTRPISKLLFKNPDSEASLKASVVLHGISEQASGPEALVLQGSYSIAIFFIVV